MNLAVKRDDNDIPISFQFYECLNTSIKRRPLSSKAKEKHQSANCKAVQFEDFNDKETTRCLRLSQQQSFNTVKTRQTKD